MSTAIVMDDSIKDNCEKPGSQLERLREQKGFTQEYIAGRLHLRVRVIELLEQDDYEKMPEPVFIKGYLRAYAKLLGVAPEPFLDSFNEHYGLERKPEKTLWQGKKESNKNEKIVRMLTIVFAVSIIVAAGLWWYKNNDVQSLFSSKDSSTEEVAQATETLATPKESEIRLTDLSKMQSMFATIPSDSPEVEKQRG